MAYQIISVASVFERFELRCDEEWGRDEFYPTAARKQDS